MQFNELIGYKITSQNKENASLQLKIEAKHLNVHGTIHGGVYFSCADAACGAIVMTTGDKWVTLDASINYLKSVSSGIITVNANVVNQTRKTMIIDAEIVSEDLQRLAVARFTMYRIDI